MKLHIVVLLITLFGFTCVLVNDYLFSVRQLEQKSLIACKAFTAKKFIAESFRNTCKGKGFDSLEEWKLCCNALFDLEYINWEQVNNEPQNLKLLYAEWKGKDLFVECSGEVFCRYENYFGVE